ncbi:MAG: MoaD/ThiS family protein [Candidatus Obscuribacterales bacterium]|nr:MoaD/ThiS family protein [Candidatus Obscuribacterales bacterium]
MLVLIPSPLRSYTQNRTEVDAVGTTLAELLVDLEKKYPGIRFRMIDEQDQIRQHIKIYVDMQPAEKLDIQLKGKEQIKIVAALSGG